MLLQIKKFHHSFTPQTYNEITPVVNEGRGNQMKEIKNICKLDIKLRETFLGELIKAEDRTSRKIDGRTLAEINKGHIFEGINIWQEAYESYKDVLAEERQEIEELNLKFMGGLRITWEELVGFFGFLLGFHEYTVHSARHDNLFKRENSGGHFYQNISMYSGIKGVEKSPYWRGSSAFGHFCVAYYVAKNSNPQVESHFKGAKGDKFDFSREDRKQALSSADSIKNKLGGNPEESFVKDIEAIYRNLKTLSETNPYKNPIMPTISDVCQNKRIKRFQCRVAQGPITPPRANTKLYEQGETLEWHEGISNSLRERIQKEGGTKGV